MRVIAFLCGTLAITLDYYNKWAAGKPLTKDVIVHTHITPAEETGLPTLCIVVFFDEILHPDWVGKLDTQI